MKRFTETSKWQDPWFRRLSATAKLLSLYIVDTCNSIGLIDLDVESAAFHIGAKVDEKHLLELGERVQRIEGGKLFVPKFISFQYSELSETCPAHKPIIKLVKQHQLTATTNGYQYPNARVLVGIQIPTGKGMDKDKEEEKEKKPSVEEVKLYVAKLGLPESDAVWFWHKCEGNGWTNGGKKIKSWQHTISSWNVAGYMPSQKNGTHLVASDTDEWKKSL
jgi:hypothetical protein